MYYVVESKFWRRKVGDKFDSFNRGVDLSDSYVNTCKEFRDSSPIKARKAAFNYYQSIIEVLYDGLDRNYKDDYLARKDLQHYLNSINEVEIGNATKFKITDDVINGIEVYMVVDRPLKGIETKANSKYCIHGIRYVDYPDRLDEDLIDTLKNLFIEHQYYEEYGYSTEKEIVLKHFDAIGGNAEFYLETPFDWENLMKEFEGQDLLNNGSL